MRDQHGICIFSQWNNQFMVFLKASIVCFYNTKRRDEQVEGALPLRS